MSISLCMIVKNEEDWVEGAGRSVRSIVEEVINVDTVSTDSTSARIARPGARAVVTKWIDLFSDARNSPLAQATKSWILVLDADERTPTFTT
jgi:glycosyltransferase involved in cell wall biosynthesis